MLANPLQTERLILRQWRATDLEPFAHINADTRVMEFFPSTLNRQESDQLTKRISEGIEERGWGLWAVSIPSLAEFIGFIGLEPVHFPAHFTPSVEIGWRLAYDFWGHGYAVEGGRAALQYAFQVLHLEEVVAFTTASNIRSRRVMEKLEMRYTEEDDFDHPKLPEGHHLRRHVLYRIKRHEFLLK